MIVVPLTKRKEIITSIHVCNILWLNFDYKGNGGKKAFLANPKQQVENMIVLPNHKKDGDYYENPSLTHLIGGL